MNVATPRWKRHSAARGTARAHYQLDIADAPRRKLVRHLLRHRQAVIGRGARPDQGDRVPILRQQRTARMELS